MPLRAHAHQVHWRLILTTFRCLNFRNIATITWAVPKGITVLTGPNGGGKTNLLEAIVILGNLTSFRPGSPRSWVRHGQAGFALAGEIATESSSFTLEQHGRLGKSLIRTLSRGGRRITPAEYLGLFPVVSFSAMDQELIFGGPELRRRFLDRLAFHLQPATLDVLLRYRRALRQRNTLLQQGRVGDSLDAFDRELAHCGRQLILSRLAALPLLQRALEEELPRLGWLFPKPILHYHSHEDLAASLAASEHALLMSLRRWRQQEVRRGCTLVGPHRDDLKVFLQGRPAREQLSAGQAKLLATALRLAATAVTTAKRKAAPLLTFDDVDAKLDGQTLDRLLRRLGELGCQVLLSTAHPEMVLPRLPDAAHVTVKGGTFGAA